MFNTKFVGVHDSNLKTMKFVLNKWNIKPTILGCKGQNLYLHHLIGEMAIYLEARNEMLQHQNEGEHII